MRTLNKTKAAAWLAGGLLSLPCAALEQGIGANFQVIDIHSDINERSALLNGLKYQFRFDNGLSVEPEFVYRRDRQTEDEAWTVFVSDVDTLYNIGLAVKMRYPLADRHSITYGIKGGYSRAEFDVKPGLPNLFNPVVEKASGHYIAPEISYGYLITPQVEMMVNLSHQYDYFDFDERHYSLDLEWLSAARILDRTDSGDPQNRGGSPQHMRSTRVDVTFWYRF